MIAEWIDQAAASRGDASYLEDAAGGGVLTFAGLRRATSGWARCLDRAGVAPGAAVALRWPDPLGYATALVGIIGAGRVVVPLDPAAPGSELSRMLQVARPQAIVCGLPTGELPAGLTVLRPAEALPAATALPGDTALLADTALPGDMAGSPGAGGIFLCTSGTTGTPKGILLRDDQIGHVAACVAGHHRLSPADRGYCCLPLFHINAEVVGLLATLAARACLVLDRRFSRRGFWPLIEEKRITWINAVPAIITVLAMDPFDNERSVVHARFIRSASAPAGNPTEPALRGPSSGFAVIMLAASVIP